MAPQRNRLNDNFGVDYVITYRFVDTSKSPHSTARLCLKQPNSYSYGGSLKKLPEPCAGAGEGRACD